MLFSSVIISLVYLPSYLQSYVMSPTYRLFSTTLYISYSSYFFISYCLLILTLASEKIFFATYLVIIVSSTNLFIVYDIINTLYIYTSTIFVLNKAEFSFPSSNQKYKPNFKITSNKTTIFPYYYFLYS